MALQRFLHSSLVFGLLTLAGCTSTEVAREIFDTGQPASRPPERAVDNVRGRLDQLLELSDRLHSEVDESGVVSSVQLMELNFLSEAAAEALVVIASDSSGRAAFGHIEETLVQMADNQFRQGDLLRLSDVPRTNRVYEFKDLADQLRQALSQGGSS